MNFVLKSRAIRSTDMHHFGVVVCSMRAHHSLELNWIESKDEEKRTQIEWYMVET